MFLSLNTAVTAGYQEVIRVSSVFSHSLIIFPGDRFENRSGSDY